MPAFKYKTEEGHQRHLAKRREYYAKNREHIRERDNASGRKRRQENPEKYKKIIAEQCQRRKEKPVIKHTGNPSLDKHPDRNLIMAAISQGL